MTVKTDHKLGRKYWSLNVRIDGKTWELARIAGGSNAQAAAQAMCPLYSEECTLWLSNHEGHLAGTWTGTMVPSA